MIQRELDRYKKTLIAEGFAIPTKAALVAKINDINALLNHKFTEEELQVKLKRSGVLQQKHIAIQRHSLQTRRKEAEYRGDKELVEKIDSELAALDGPKLAFGTSLTKTSDAPVGKTQQERLAEINRANRKFNTQNVRKAQLAERKADALQRAAIERGEAVANPFARVKVRATTHHDVNAVHVPKYKPAAENDNLPSASHLPRNKKSHSGTTTPATEAAEKVELKDSSHLFSADALRDAELDWKRAAWIELFGPPPLERYGQLDYDEYIDWDIVTMGVPPPSEVYRTEPLSLQQSMVTWS